MPEGYERFGECLAALLTLLLIGSIVAPLPQASAKTDSNSDNKMHYEPTWDSLAQWTVPEWYENAVVGFYFHWSVFSVPPKWGNFDGCWGGPGCI